jgi:hypothetical protein
MSEPLVVSISHHLGKDEALRRLKTGLAEKHNLVEFMRQL